MTPSASEAADEASPRRSAATGAGHAPRAAVALAASPRPRRAWRRRARCMAQSRKAKAGKMQHRRERAVWILLLPAVGVRVWRGRLSVCGGLIHRTSKAAGEFTTRQDRRTGPGARGHEPQWGVRGSEARSTDYAASRKRRYRRGDSLARRPLAPDVRFGGANRSEQAAQWPESIEFSPDQPNRRQTGDRR